MLVRTLRRKRVQIAPTILGLLAAVSLAPAAAAQSPLLASADVLAGPSPGVMSLGGLSVARDGTGGLVFLEQAGGAAHVFVSSLTNGQFQPPVRVDTGSSLAGASSQPVIAAGAGGLLQIAFINGGELYLAQRASSRAAWQAPQAMAAGASNPSIQLNSEDGKAYLAFTAAQDGGDNVLVDYYDDGQWSQATGPVNVIPGDDAGTGSGRPAVAAAGDGIGIVTWGEGGARSTRGGFGERPRARLRAARSGADVALAGSGRLQRGLRRRPVDRRRWQLHLCGCRFDETLQGPAPGDETQTRVLLARLTAEQVSTAVADRRPQQPGVRRRRSTRRRDERVRTRVCSPMR